MILYKGKQYESHKQSDLINTLYDDCLSTLSNQNRLETKDVIQACDSLTKKILSGEFDDTIKPLLEEFDIPDEYFSKYVSMFTRESLEEKVKFELGEDYDITTNLDEHNSKSLYPLGILFHIAAGNLDVLPAYSVIEGLLVGNINILKLPTGDKGVSVDLLSELINIEPKLRDYIYVFDVPSTEVETLQQFANMADAIVVWGGDEAVKAARKMAPINTKIIDWGHKLSFAYASLDASNEDLIGLARHIASTNQLLCSSAQGIFVDTDNRNELDKFAERFFQVFHLENTNHQPVPFGMMSKNAVELHYENLVQHKTKKKIWKQSGISVITSDDSKLELSMLFRNVWIKMLPKKDIVKQLKPHKNHLQTVSVLAPKSEYDDYVKYMIQAGLVRIKQSHEMSDIILGESHDGAYPLRLYSRIVEVFNK